MNIKFYPGFVVYRNGRGPTYVTPHSGPALEITTSRDDNSETVASLCWLKTGGTLIVSNISRKRLFGIDFNRDIPPPEKALGYYEKFKEDEDQEALYKFRKRYAFVAKDREDYRNRLKMYRDFWNEIRKGHFIVLVHRAFTRLKAVPSVMDLSTFQGKGIDTRFLKRVVSDINIKYSEFFELTDFEYKNVAYLEQKRAINNILRIYGDFDLKRIKADFLINIKKDLRVIKRYANKRLIERLDDDFSPQNFLLATRSALEKIGNPKITVEHVFRGSLATGPKRQLFPARDKIIIQFEPTTFLNFWYPNEASDMIIEIVNRVTERSIHE
ncbi:MAG: hypothetical protein KAU24_02490 [Candidatus Aenigmarchaeota archaeon]|nr:hypothetical protein [Candidatus Aenigmarchaeota archaeon]